MPWPDDLVWIVAVLTPQTMLPTADLSGALFGERYQAVGTVELDRLLWHQLLELASSGQSFVVGEQIVRFALQPEGVRSPDTPDKRITLDVRPT